MAIIKDSETITGNVDILGYLHVVGNTTLDGSLTLGGSSISSAWTAYTPTISSVSGTFTSVSGAGRFIKIGKTISLIVSVSITTIGTAGGGILATLPATAQGVNFAFAGREDAVTGVALAVWVSDVNHLTMQKYDGTFLGANGYLLVASGTYEAA